MDLGSFDDAVYNHEHNRFIELGTEFSLPPAPRWHLPAEDQPETFRFRAQVRLRATQGDPIGTVIRYSLADDLSGKELVVRYRANRDPQVTVPVGDRPVKVDWSPAKWMTTPGEHANRFFKALTAAVATITGQEPTEFEKAQPGLRRLAALLESVSVNVLMMATERVSSGRAAPQRWYPRRSPIVPFARGFVHQRVFDRVDPAILEDASYSIFLPSPPRRAKGQRLTMAGALKRLEIASELSPQQLSAYHSSIYVTDSVTRIRSNLIDVGYGASQVMPVIRACLSDSFGPLFVEQPEIHLHPNAQAELGEILCEASTQRQVVVETHSVHLINRARVLILEGKLDPESVIINYVRRGKGGSRIHRIGIREDGEFLGEWPEGFFDRRYQDTLELMSLRAKKEQTEG